MRKSCLRLIQAWHDMVTIVLSPIPSYISWLIPLEASLDFCVAKLPVGLARDWFGGTNYIFNIGLVGGIT